MSSWGAHEAHDLVAPASSGRLHLEHQVLCLFPLCDRPTLARRSAVAPGEQRAELALQPTPRLPLAAAGRLCSAAESARKSAGAAAGPRAGAIGCAPPPPAAVSRAAGLACASRLAPVLVADHSHSLPPPRRTLARPAPPATRHAPRRDAAPGAAGAGPGGRRRRHRAARGRVQQRVDPRDRRQPGAGGHGEGWWRWCGSRGGWGTPCS